MGDPGFWTIMIMSCVFVGLVGWDVYVAFGNHVPNREDTISGILLNWSKTVWILPYAFGVLCGHLFLPASPLSVTECPHWLRIAVIFASAFVIEMIGVWVRRRGIRVAWPVQAPLLLISGIAVGHALWYQLP
jgi:hypothetical protein